MSAHNGSSSAGLDLHAEGRLIADRVAALIGPAQVAIVGDETVPLIGALLEIGMDPVAVDVDARATWLSQRHPGVGRMSAGDVASGRATPAASLEIIASPPDRMPQWTRSVSTMLLIVPSAITDAALDAWRAGAAAHGWGQHPRQGFVTWRGDMLDAHGLRLLAFAKGGAEVADVVQRARLTRAERCTAFVRPGDRVALLTQAPETYRCVMTAGARPSLIVGVEGPATEEGDAATDVDFIVLEETGGAEALGDSLALHTDRLHRSGRLALSVQFGPAFTAASVIPELMRRFAGLGLVLERAWWQWVDGHPSAGSLVEFDMGSNAAWGESDASHMLVIASRVRSGRWPKQPEECSANIIAFQRDYEDPSIVRSMVSIGLRIESAPIRRELAAQVLREATERSADRGAALCVLCYDWFSSPLQSSAAPLLDAAMRYLEGATDNPTMLRWQVSLAYVSALIQQQLGMRHEAIRLFQYVIDRDVLGFSPLLGTKTMAAALSLGWMSHAVGDALGAMKYWQHALSEAERLATRSDWSEVRGRIDAPETFGMPEMALVMDEAGRAAAALRVLGEAPARSAGLAWQAANVSSSARARQSAWQRTADQAWASSIQEGKDWLENQYHALTSRVAQLEETGQDSDADYAALRVSYTGVQAAFRLAHKSHQRQVESQIAQLDAARNAAEADREARRLERMQATQSLAEAEERVRLLVDSVNRHEQREAETNALDYEARRLLKLLGRTVPGNTPVTIDAIRRLASEMESTPASIMWLMSRLSKWRSKRNNGGR